MLQNATPLRKSAPWPPNISDEHVSCTAPDTENASLQILFKCPTPAIMFGSATKPSRFAHFCQGAHSLAPNKKWSEPGVFCTFWLQNVLRTTTACTFSTSPLPKEVRSWCALYFLTSKCASRHNGVHFFDIATSKTAPNLVFCTFWLQNVLRATTACTFSTLQLPKVIRTRGVFNILTSKMFRATTACNFSSLIWPAGSAPAALASLLFDPPEPQIIGKTQCFATLLPFRASGSSFFWDFLFFDLLSSSLRFSSLTTSAFHLSILSEVWLLNFLRSVQEVIVISKNEC